MSENKQQAIKILCCFQRNNLSESSRKDILETMKGIFPESSNILNMDYLQSCIEKHPLKEVHYCEICNNVFPTNTGIFNCNSTNCSGLRYKGALINQQKPKRQPRRSFIIADIQKQLEKLLQTPGIMQDIERCKAEIRHREMTGIITDLTDGSAYRDMMHIENGFLTDGNNLTGIINTDGVNLYSSSKIELWPVFLAINELNPKLRFARENMLLLGIWQGKGKPPFKQFFDCIIPELNELYHVGIQIHIDGYTDTVKLAVVCGVFDLPAKASVHNMTYYNGKEACISCEEPGIRVAQGKGSAHCYPYRRPEERYPVRTHESVMANMQDATDRERIKGFNGLSSLASLQSYNLIEGTVPDYMHGILMGITNTLLSKFFSPSQSGKQFFIGKHIKKNSKRLCKIQPPPFIERLPLDLGKNFQNFKATELQAWLLYYSLPCLSGILPHVFLNNLSYLSEAIYVLLGDHISAENLERASHLLEKFYSEFGNLYGQGSSGLNIHNAGFHLISYVKLWGPVRAWSCFPFEDCNSALLQSAHGTGNVMKQVLRNKEVDSNLRRKCSIKSSSGCWKVTRKASNCDICGKVKPLSNMNLVNEVVGNNEINWVSVKKLQRVSNDGQQFSSVEYKRMERRVCHVVLFGENRIGSILCFLLDESVDIVYAVIQCFERCLDTEIGQLEGGKHIISVRATREKEIVLAESLLETLMFIDVSDTIDCKESMWH